MQAFFMNATFLSSGTASAAGAVATPGNLQAGAQENGVFQTLLAGQAAHPGAGSFVAPVATNSIGRADLPVDTAGQPVPSSQTAAAGVPAPTVSGDTTALNLLSASSQTDTAASDQPINNDPLMAMLEPMRDQLAALGIDIDTLGTAKPAMGKPVAPVQDAIAAPAALKATVQVQDTQIPTAPTASPGATETGLAKTLAPEPARPEAALPQRASLIGRITERLEDLKNELGGLQMSAPIIQGLEHTISQLNTLSQVNGMISAPVADPLIASLATQGAPLATASANIATPAGTPATSSPTASAPGHPLSAATAEDAAPAAGKPTGAAKQAATMPAPEVKLPAFATPSLHTPAAPQVAATAAQASAAAPATPVPAASADAAPEFAAAAQQVRPTSTPGSQLAERNNKVASAQAAGGNSGAKSATSAAPAQATGQAQPTATPSAPAPAETILQEPRMAAPLPGQAGFDAQLAQAQPTSEQNLGLRTDQDLSLQRADGRSAAERPTHEGQRFTPQSAQQLAAQITRRFANGNRVFDIRLDPAELGRVDVRLELTGDQRVQAILSVERPETLAELQRSARDLERALNEAGLELENDGLEFQLNENADDQGFDADEDPDVLPVFVESDELEMAALANEPAVERDAYGFRLAASRDRLDMRI